MNLLESGPMTESGDVCNPINVRVEVSNSEFAKAA